MFFFLPLYDDNPTQRPPLVTYFLIGLCIGAFLWQRGQNQAVLALSYGMIPAVLFGEAHLAPALRVVPAWATIFTSMFLHGGWLHLGGNMLFLWIFGNNVEDLLGRVRYLILYFGGGIAAALSQALAAPSSHAPMIGASGAIASVLGAYMLVYPRANVHCFLWVVIFFRIITVPAWILLGLWFAIQLESGLGSAHSAGGVAVWAHVGGFLAGLLLVLPLRPPGVRLWQPSRSRLFASAHPREFIGRATFHRGSVPPAGRRFSPDPNPRRGPWG